MSRADGVHSSTCLHIAEPCDRPSCSWCSCDEEPLADWERDLLNEANATATLTAQRDAARDIAARLEGELARVDRDIRALPGAPKAVERVSDLYGILAPFVGPHDLCSVCSVREGRDGDEFERCADCVNAGRHSAGGRGECEVCAAWADGWNKGKRIGREGALKEVVAVLDADPDAVIAEGES